MLDILRELNKEQIEAVKQINGPVLVLAGAGSGKTKALTHRIAYLVKQKKVAPSNILAITFTNKAAEEIKDRVLKITGKRNSKDFNISTFHSFCARLLRREAGKLGYSLSFSILDADDQLTAIKQAMEQLNIDPKRTVPEAVRAHISSAKNELVGAKEYSSKSSGTFQRTVARIYPIYQAILQNSQAMDFDDLIMNAVILFESHPDVLNKYQNQFQYLLIDEYQDTNTAQYRLAKLLASSHNNIFVVGDDWQSIYSWRGANYQNILNFHRDYPKAKIVKLERNYRSTQNILDGAHAIISHNQNRSDKKLWTKQDEGEPIIIYQALNEKNEGEFIWQEIGRIQADTKATRNDFVILYRTNAQSRSLEESLLRAGIPYRVVGGVRFYERKEIKDMLAYLKLINNPDDNIALARIINTPRRGIGKKGFLDLEKAARDQQISIYSYLKNIEKPTPQMAGFVQTMERIFKKSRTVVLSKLLNFILAATGYKLMLKSEGVEGETRLENIFELKSVMEKYDHLPPQEALTIFLEEVSLIADIDDYNPEDEAITLMTIHSAKGLEFDYVFVAGMEENIFPHSRTLFDQEELEEERRLCYVAITRARKRVYLIYAQERLLYGSLQNNPPSRFISDLPEHLTKTIKRQAAHGYTKSNPYSDTEIKAGDKIKHKKFGDGIVISKTGDVLTVAFTKEGIKNLASGIAEIKLRT
ncbi:ATP-dependent DNA helicase PcrA [candidate division Kazan bacterium]|uniref:DNA 3'-5' helicase n=1 Tax=candidate division Kazan bacterium TaxID=2202143 RepID=A0A420ZDE6_UNCK3|nr:MAG: ATP-dependent DNA helicase PcrA [candidate division Kazan bacterium]